MGSLTDVMGLLKGLMGFGFLGKWMDSLKDLMKCLEDFISFLKVWECWVPLKDLRESPKDLRKPPYVSKYST